MKLSNNIVTIVNIKRSKYQKTCATCLKDKKNTEGCAHCKKTGCPNDKSDGKSICNGCFNKERRERQRPMKGSSVEKPKHIKYPGVCLACELQGFKNCDHCKKLNCVNKKKEGRQVCEFCDKQDSLKGSQLYRKRKIGSVPFSDQGNDHAGSVLFSDKRKDHAKEEKAILQEIILEEIKYKKQKSVHYSHPPSELQNNCLPAHHYTQFQFYNKQLLEETTQRGEERPSKIRVLADQEYGKTLKDCLPMNDILKDIADAGKAMLCSEPGVSDLTLGAATLHIQDEVEARGKTTSVYPPHRDKGGVGQFVMFHQISGLSFTFIAVEGKEEGAHFDTSSQGWDRYEEWKAYSGNETSKKVQKFESIILKQAQENKKTTNVQVYELRAGQSLCFAADYFCHASIIPAQVKNTMRALLVFHELIAVSSVHSSSTRKKEKEAAKEEDTPTDCIRPFYKNKPDHPRMVIGGKATPVRNTDSTMPGEKSEPSKPPPQKLPMPTAPDAAESPQNAPGRHPLQKVLFLGMAYSDPEKLRKKLSHKELSLGAPLQKEHIELLVGHLKEVQTQDGRDMWRILAVEEIYGCEVYTVANVSSPETAARYSDNRHFQCDWNGRHLCNELEGHVFGQIFVDYFWLQPGWQETRITRGIITNTIIGFATRNILKRGCMMVLPFTPHILGLVLKNEKLVNEHYEIEYRTGNETEDLVLYTTTSALDKEKMTAIFEKDLEGQDEEYLSHTVKDVKERLEDYLAKPFLRSLRVDVASIRFIVLIRRK
jgi:hypothetical protein